MAFGSQIRIDFSTSHSTVAERLNLAVTERLSGPPSRPNVRFQVRREVHAGASPEELDVSRHQLLRDVSSGGPRGRVVIRPLDEELGSSVFHGSVPE